MSTSACSVISYTVWPQVAIWLERLDGSFPDTPYVTRVVEIGDFDATPKEGRPEVLLVCSALNARAAKDVDAVSPP